MKYEQAILKAKDFINSESPKIRENNATYYRNRLIDYAATQYAQKPVYSLIEDQTRADHYGVNVGDKVKLGYRVNDNQLAAAKKVIRKLLNSNYRKLWVAS